jgi:hypothetical protein
VTGSAQLTGLVLCQGAKRVSTAAAAAPCSLAPRLPEALTASQQCTARRHLVPWHCRQRTPKCTVITRGGWIHPAKTYTRACMHGRTTCMHTMPHVLVDCQHEPLTDGLSWYAPQSALNTHQCHLTTTCLFEPQLTAGTSQQLGLRYHLTSSLTVVQPPSGTEPLSTQLIMAGHVQKCGGCAGAAFAHPAHTLPMDARV